MSEPPVESNRQRRNREQRELLTSIPWWQRILIFVPLVLIAFGGLLGGLIGGLGVVANFAIVKRRLATGTAAAAMIGVLAAAIVIYVVAATVIVSSLS